MTNEDFEKLFDAAVKAERELMISKSADYAGGGDRLWNFRSVTIKLKGVDETMKFRTERDIPHESIPCAIKGEYDECWIIKYDDALEEK